MTLYLNTSTEEFLHRRLLEELEEKQMADCSKCAVQAKFFNPTDRKINNLITIRKNQGWTLPDLKKNTNSNHWLPSRISKHPTFLSDKGFETNGSLFATTSNGCFLLEGPSVKMGHDYPLENHYNHSTKNVEDANDRQKSQLKTRKKSGILAMTDLEFAWFERAHMESNLIEIYSEPSLRFCALPPTPSFAIVQIQMSEKGSEPELKVDRFMTRCYEQASPSSTLFDDKGHFKVSQMDVLSEKIWSFHNSMTQTDTTLSRKLYLRDLLYYVICPIFPMCGLYVVGSSLNGFGNNTSDMDVCLMITNHDLDQKKDAIVVLNLVFTSLNKVEWIAEQQLIFAKVPILRIKFQAPYSDIIVDLNVNNSVAIRNTHLLSYYSNFDWRIRPLVTIVKEWAKRKGINDANQSSFTSYSLVLMVIHYLQCGVEPRLLPSLQRAFPKRFNGNNDVRSLNVTMMLPPIENWDYNDKITLGELLIGFLDYYANQFDYDTDAISIHDGVKIDRRAIVSQQLPRHGSSQAAIGSGSWRSQWRCICIEEPFTNLNTAHSIYDEMVFNEIKQAFRESHDELNVSRDLTKWLAQCKPITACPPKAGGVIFCAPYEGSSDHVMAVTASQKASNSTQNAAASGRSSTTSGSSLMENDSERQPSPVSQLFEKAHTTRWNNANSPPSSKSNMNGNNQAGQKRNSYQQSGTYRSYRPNNNQGPRKSYNNRSYHNQQRNGAPTPNGPNC